MKQYLKFLLPLFKVISAGKDLTFVFLFVTILSIIIVPMPSWLLDIFLSISIAISVWILLISLFIDKPTSLTTFPTLILIITLYRLALNISTTRMILSKGHEGPDNVSSIIQGFGDFVVGGNFVIGIIVFIILVIINFMVITKGSTRVAEVAARFTLDAMPGKQMAIDADLNAGMIDEEQARTRRAEIIKEASFYGAMDGSSKFVQGDAVAGIVITIINIIGGFMIGVFQQDMALADSAEVFTILTIGDGLVSQIPALILSTATGIIITRATNDKGESFAIGAVDQLVSNYKVLLIVGFIMVMFALVPGLPTFSLGIIGLLFLLLGFVIKYSQEGGLENMLMSPEEKSMQKIEENAKEQEKKKQAPENKEDEEKKLQDILKVEVLELDLGYGLIRLADIEQGGDLLERIKSMRRTMASDIGFLMPQIRIRDNLRLDPQGYQLLLKGVAVGEGQVQSNKFLAMDSGLVSGQVAGDKTKEPAFGLDAIWIDKEDKEDAIMKGYTIVDTATVISTHISELVKQYSHELLTRQEVQKLVDNVKEDYPVIVDDALKVANIGLIQKILKELLKVNIPIKDMLTILESITDIAEYSKNVDVITEHTRAKLSRIITSLYTDETNTLKLITLEANTERKLLEALRERDGLKELLLSIAQINALVDVINQKSMEISAKGISPTVIIVDPSIRKALSDIFEKFGLSVVVLSHAEIDSSAKFEVLEALSVEL